jgi:hypothetical protein
MLLQSFSFAPADAKPNTDYVYALPFDEKMPRMVGQSFGGEKTHYTPVSYHAVDFLMPVGTPVLAAREGTVAKVIQGHTTHCFEPENPEICSSAHGNEIIVLHEDGTFATYLHLDSSGNGIVVEKGQKVNRKQLLGHSGFNGYINEPHLHFDLNRISSREMVKTIPYVFQNGDANSYLPKKNDVAGSPPAITGDIVLYIGEKQVESGSGVEPTHTLKKNESVQLRAEFQKSDGSVEDITNSPHIIFHVVNPRFLTASGTGVVTASPMPDFIDSIQRNVGKPYSELGLPLLWVVYDNGEESDFGWTNLVFEIDYEGEDIIQLP